MINGGMSGALIKMIYNDLIRYNLTGSCWELFDFTYFRLLKYVKNEFRFFYTKKSFLIQQSQKMIF